ncbi:urease accessory protein UreD [Rhodovulum iodosum]|nr:urease accessory protein UreD [Rhodovulum robiginosum]
MGRIAVAAKATARGSVLQDLHQAGAMKALFPRPRGPALDVISINSAGGITGGDRFRLEARAGAGAHLRVTTQAAERAYRAQPGETGQVRNLVSAGPGARAEWLPQETILYDGAALDRRLDVELAGDAAFLMVEPLVFGRLAMGEALTDARFRDRISIRREGVPVYRDGLGLTGDICAHLGRRGVAGGGVAMASMVLAAPGAEAHLAPLRALMPRTGGVSLIRPDLLVLRLVAADGYALRKTLVPVLTRLTDNALPRSWMT